MSSTCTNYTLAEMSVSGMTAAQIRQLLDTRSDEIIELGVAFLRDEAATSDEQEFAEGEEQDPSGPMSRADRHECSHRSTRVFAAAAAEEYDRRHRLMPSKISSGVEFRFLSEGVLTFGKSGAFFVAVPCAVE